VATHKQHNGTILPTTTLLETEKYEYVSVIKSLPHAYSYAPGISSGADIDRPAFSNHADKMAGMGL